MDGWPCQRVSLYKDSKMASGSVRILSWVMTHLGWQKKPRIRAFLRLLGLCCLNDKTSHRFQGENISDGLLSQIFERREKENEQLGWLIVWKSAVHFQPIGITRFAAHLSRPKMPDITILAFGLYITYRAILNIELYNWLLQKGLLKHRFCITIYLYRAIQYHAVLPVKNCTPISLHIHTCYNPIHMYAHD